MASFKFRFNGLKVSIFCHMDNITNNYGAVGEM